MTDAQAFRLARLVGDMPAGILSLDRAWRVGYVNAEASRLLGVGADRLVGQTIWDAFPGTVGTEFERHYRAAVETGRPVTFESFYPEPLNAWYEVRVWPTDDGLTLYLLDITVRRSVQRRLDDANEQAGLLAEVTSQLAATLNMDETVARLATLVVPSLADWCVVSLVDVDRPDPLRALIDSGSWHVDPELRETVAEYARGRSRVLNEQSYLAQSLRTGEPVILGAEQLAAAVASLTPGRAHDLLAGLAPSACALFPLPGRGRTVGFLSLFNGPERGPFTPAASVVAADVAARAGLAMDNARLFDQQRRLAEGLQRSLLTAPPEPDHMQIVVRYTPAAEAAQVGGDWYDAFLQPAGATVLVIGDVVGHDTAAAAAMGQLRSLLRGIAASGDAGPADILCTVDQVMETLQVDTTATVVVARVEQTPDEQARGVTHLRWSNAGHPNPMVINPDGTVAVLGGVEADLLLGMDPASRRMESEVAVDRGATVLLYTDGLVERRGQSIDEGMNRLRDTLLELADSRLDELCDELLARMLPSRPEDDVAIVAVRLHRQDRPRPLEAGPVNIPSNVPGESAGQR